MDGEPDAQLHFPDASKLELDQLLDELVERAQGVKRTQGRLRALLRAIELITSDLALDVVLRNIVMAARELASARYAALGVVAPGGGGLEDFLHVGMDPDSVEQIGHLPQGKGLLGALIADPRPIRLRDLSADDRSTGFPRDHPPMASFLGVPIRVGDEVFGNLYLTDAQRGEFSAEDEELVSALGLAAGTAIRNARSYEESRLQQRWLEASAEIGSQLLAATGEDPLHLVARRAFEIAGADAVTMGLRTADGAAMVIESAFGTGVADLAGKRVELEGTLAGQVVTSGRALRLGAPPGDAGPSSHLASFVEVGPLMVIPLSGAGGVRGVLTLVRRAGRREFTGAELSMASGFAAHASVAIELADARAAEQRVVLLEDRDRIARDLHDHVIQELFAVGLSLQGMAARLGPDDAMGRRALQRVEDLDRTIRRIRTSIFDLRGNLATSSDGLRQRILEIASELTAAVGFAPHVGFSGLVDLDLDAALTDDVQACVREALTNVAKHARARSVSIDVSSAQGVLTVAVSDDGIGPSGAAQRSSGLANLRARAERHGGACELVPGPTGGSVLKWTARTVAAQ